MFRSIAPALALYNNALVSTSGNPQHVPLQGYKEPINNKNQKHEHPTSIVPNSNWSTKTQEKEF